MATSRHLVEPSLSAQLDLMPPLRLPMVDLAEIRAAHNQRVPDLRDYAHADIAIEDHVVEGAPHVRIRIYRPKAARDPLPVFLHIHGGGYVMGSPAAAGPRNVAAAIEANCLVASVQYRLAPETPAPGALEDCYAALCWLQAEASKLHLNPSRIAVGGDSAGGGLAAALCLLARDRDGPAVCFQMLIYPMIDDRTGLDDDDASLTGEFVWTRESNQFAWSALLGDRKGRDDLSPYLAAARAKDMSRLPATYIAVGALDLFLLESMDYAQRLLQAGVPTELHVFPGAYHGFEYASESPLAQAALRERWAALAKALHGAD